MGFRLPLILAAILMTALSAAAQLPVARLYTISPAGGQVGTTFEVSITGADLDEVTALRFTDTNVTGTPKVAETGLPEANKFVLTLSSNALPGVCEVRAVGRFGISNPRLFAIGQQVEITERGDNHSATNAMHVPLGSTGNAQADGNTIDYFRFPARKGQRILIECRTQAIDSRMDPLMILYDDGGRELDRARNRDLLDFTAPEDGANLLQVSDFLYRGGPEYFYRLTIHAGPRIEFIMPLSAQPGTTNKHTVYGRNLPGGVRASNRVARGKTLEQIEVEIAAPSPAAGGASSASPSPAALGIDGFHYRLTTSSNVTHPIFIPFAVAPVVIESSGNDRGEQAQKISPPCEVSGQLFPAGDQDWFSFDAKKGDIYWLEIFSERLGAPTDPMLVVQRVSKNDKGEASITDLQETYDSEANIGGAEFKTSSRDPAWRFEVKEDGAYRVQVRDLFNRTTADPRHVYRLAVRKEAPDFRLAVLPQLPGTKKEREVGPWCSVLRRGETLPLRVLAQRRDGFGDDIALSVAGCPADVSATPAKIENGKNSTLLFLTASADATNWGGAIKVIGKAKQGDKEFSREATEGTSLWRVEDYNTEPVNARVSPDVMLATAPEIAPIIIAAAPTNTLEATAGTKLRIPLTIIRHGDFNEKLKLKIAGAPPLDAAKELEIDSKGTNATFELDLAKLAPGVHTVYFQTQTKGKYRNNPEGAKLAEDAAKQAETNFTALNAEAKKAPETAAPAAKTAEETAATEKASAELVAKVKLAEGRKTALAARAKEMTEKAKAKEVTISVYSPPFEIKVNPAPATAAANK